jgi:hypothetical protein
MVFPRFEDEVIGLRAAAEVCGVDLNRLRYFAATRPGWAEKRGRRWIFSRRRLLELAAARRVLR